jgi:ligand-binding sensor domain-containing protein/two-component sensor histidine kinase
MKSGIAIILFINFLALTFSLYAQHPVYRQYTVDDGLLSNEIYHVTQDSKGYIWVASNMGVSRYDGKQFRNFDKQDGLPENTVFEIYEDSTGRVWFVSFPCQLSYFYNDTIYPYRFNNKLKEFARNGTIPVKGSFIVNYDESLYIGFIAKGLYFINSHGDLVQYEGSGRNHNLKIIEKGENLLFSQLIGEMPNDTAEVSTSIVSKKFLLKRSPNYSYSNIYASKDKNAVFFARNEYLSRISSMGIILERNMISRIIYLISDLNNDLWVGTDKTGVFCFKNGNILSDPILHYLDNISVSSILFDKEGGKWFSSLESGLYYLPSSSFISYTINDGLTSNKINTLELFQNQLVIGANDPYLNILSKGNLTAIKITESLNGYTLKLHNDKDKVLWIGTNDYLYSFRNGIAVKFSNNHRKIKEKEKTRGVFSIKDLITDRKGRLIIGESMSLSFFYNGNVIYNSFLDDNIGIRIEAVLEIKSDEYLLGTNNGLWKYSNGRFENLSEKNPALQVRITDILYSEQHNVLIYGTKGSGLIVQYKDSTISFTKSNGLSSNSISSLFLSGNNLWIATNYGLNVLDISKIGSKDFKISSYYKLNGLISNEINEITGDSNNIYIATNQGLTIFNYSNYKPLLVNPPVYISSFSILKKDTTIKSGYRLSSSQNLITIKFIGISFREAANLKYKYRLEGLDPKWNYTKNSEVEYAFLPPGKYAFQVVAINSDGIESAEPAHISFTILPPFWKTWWFIMLVLSIIAAIAYIYYINRMKQIRKEHGLRNDIDWYRQQALAKQMDPHFVFNTLNSIQSFIIKNDRLASSQYLSKFARLMRIILNSSQKQAVPLSDEISALSLYLELESLRFQQKFDFNLVVDPSIDSSACFIPAFLIQPFIENAIWHGIMGLKETGRIDIEFQKNRNQLTCIVEDNGIGRKRSMELKTAVPVTKQSYGIALVESRLALLNNLYDIDIKIRFVDLYNENGQPSGTRVIINLPLIS